MVIIASLVYLVYTLCKLEKAIVYCRLENTFSLSFAPYWLMGAENWG